MSYGLIMSDPLVCVSQVTKLCSLEEVEGCSYKGEGSRLSFDHFRQQASVILTTAMPLKCNAVSDGKWFGIGSFFLCS